MAASLVDSAGPMQHQPYQAPAAAAPGGLSTGSYEFDPIQNATIATMGSRAWWWGLVSVITGVLGVLLLGGAFAVRDELARKGVPPDLVTMVSVGLAPIVITHLVIAFSYMSAGRSLKAVVHTQGNDVEHLMQSLHKLGTAFMVEFIVGMLAIVVGFSAGLYLASEGIDITSSDFDFDFD